MYRIIEGKVYGVLTDFDLSSWRKDLANDYSKTSQQRTGTPPYMAFGMLDESEPVHLYRHDVESLFYILLILTTHYEIQAPGKGKKKTGGLRMRKESEPLPFHDWFNESSYKALGRFKHSFLSKAEKTHLSPNFQDFGHWVENLRRSFRLGLRSQGEHIDRLSEGGDIPRFDNETFGGHVSYSALINPARNLPGKLRGLIVRYESEPGAPNTASTVTTKTRPLS